MEGAGAQVIAGTAVRDVGVLGELIFVDFLALLWDLAFLFDLFEGVGGKGLLVWGGAS